MTIKDLRRGQFLYLFFKRMRSDRKSSFRSYNGLCTKSINEKALLIYAIKAACAKATKKEKLI